MRAQVHLMRHSVGALRKAINSATAEQPLGGPQPGPVFRGTLSSVSGPRLVTSWC
jgi:hypothetical protein